MSQHCDNATFQILRYQRRIVSTADRAEVDKLFASISAVSVVAELDDNFPVVQYDERGSLLSPHGENREVKHRHTTLKLSCPTRWNSTLAIVESIIICMEKSRMHSRDSVTLSCAFTPKRLTC